MYSNNNYIIQNYWFISALPFISLSPPCPHFQVMDLFIDYNLKNATKKLQIYWSLQPASATLLCVVHNTLWLIYFLYINTVYWIFITDQFIHCCMKMEYKAASKKKKKKRVIFLICLQHQFGGILQQSWLELSHPSEPTPLQAILFCS